MYKNQTSSIPNTYYQVFRLKNETSEKEAKKNEAGNLVFTQVN